MKHVNLIKIYAALLLVIFALIIIHAPLSVFFGTQFPDFALFIKAWKEIVMLIAAILAIILLSRKHLWKKLFSDKIIWLTLVFIVPHLLSLWQWNGLEAAMAGLMIDLRFVVYFGLVYVLMLLAPQYRRMFVKVFVAGAFLVIGFALLQQVLPRDFLANFGYSDDTIAPYMTVDENDDFVRHNSTLRGPNPLGAYAATVATVCLAWLIGMKQKRNWPIICLAIASVFVVYLSYARSAYLALAIGFVITLVTLFGKKVKKWQWLSLGAVTLVLIGGLFLLRNNDFVSNVVLHEDPGESNNLNSNDGHIDSLAEGTERMLSQPLGAGVGSTGSASLLTENGLIIENYYLYVAHEAGWLGLAIFLALFALVLKRLWSERKNPLALGVFASGIGLAVACLFLPVFADDTVSIIWWGLAALAVAPREKVDSNKKHHKVLAGNKKSGMLQSTSIKK